MNELPKTNPMITDDQFKECHLALGPNLENMPAESWAIAQEEKSKDMVRRPVIFLSMLTLYVSSPSSISRSTSSPTATNS